jgi:hypothetical protein
MTRTVLYLAFSFAVVAFAAANAGADANVPFKGTDSFGSAVIGGSGAIVQTADSGSGVATHLGRFTLAASETVDFGTLAVTNGAFTLTGANGDTVSGNYSGHLLPSLDGYVVSGPITTGTGRFAGATGLVTFRGAFDPATFTGTDVITGTISSVGSLS